MKFLITLLILTTVAFIIRQQEEQLVLPSSSITVHTNQQLILGKSSFHPMYMHVFKHDKDGPLEHVNLTDEMRNAKMTIKSFEKLVFEENSIWIAYLSREGDDEIYVCELEEALKVNEISLINK